MAETGDRLTLIGGEVPLPFSKKTDTGLEGPQVLLGACLDSKAASKNRILSLRVRRGSE